MKKFVRLTYLLTIFILFDLTATIYWVSNDLGHEANPIMAFFLDVSPLLFVLVKLGLSAGGIGILYYYRKRFSRKIFHILIALNLVYAVLFAYHLWGVLFLWLPTN